MGVTNSRKPESDDTRHKKTGSDLMQFVWRVLIVAAVWVLLNAAWTLSEVLLLVFAGVLLAVLLRGLADLISSHTPLPSGWSLALVGLLLIIIIGGAVALLGPRVATEIDELQRSLPRSIQQLRNSIEQYEWGRQLLEEVPTGPGEILGGDLLSRITGIFSRVLNLVTTVVFVLFIGIFLAAEPGMYVSGIVKLVPMSYRERARQVLHTLGYTLKSWLLGQGIGMLTIGVLTTLGYWLLGVPLALTLGILAGLLEFMPTIGPPIANSLAALMALTVSPQLALYVVILAMAVQFLESNILMPIVQKQAVHLPPMLTLGSQIVAGILFGFLGLLLAVPLMAVIYVLVKMIYVEDVLGDEVAVKGEDKVSGDTGSSNKKESPFLPSRVGGDR